MTRMSTVVYTFNHRKTQVCQEFEASLVYIKWTLGCLKSKSWHGTIGNVRLQQLKILQYYFISHC